METIALSAPEEQPTPPDPNPDAGVGSQYKEFRPLYDQFNVKVESDRHDKAFEAIWEWAKAHSPGKDKDSVLFEIIKLNNRLGSPNMGMKPYAKLENYVTVWKQHQMAEKRLRDLEIPNH